MSNSKRWSVTYTKHIKQKRKVYQDGLLELHSSRHKVMLFDDCEKLLDSRFLKQDDVLRSGETLAFDTYLVDIGDLHGDHKKINDVDQKGTDKKTSEKVGSWRELKIRGDSNSRFGKYKSKACNVSPSQKIIREFKKSEMNKYGSSSSCSDSMKNSMTEWQVLYTTQITQKAKKFHEGYLKVSVCGAQGRQVMLHDATRRLIDSRCLKKDEVIRTGESLTFDGHLVEIEEYEGNHEVVIELDIQKKNCDVVGPTEAHQAQEAQVSNNCPFEWDAMYTKQISQKATKYQSGILRLEFCGSYQKQVILLTEDGTTVSRRYLKLTEDVRNGSTFQLPNYLVEVGEPRTTPAGKFQYRASSFEVNASKLSSYAEISTKSSREVPPDKPLCDEGEPRNNAGPWNKTLRDAYEILSILKKPATQEGIVTMGRASAEKFHALQASDFHKSYLKNQMEGPVKDFCSERTTVEEYDGENTVVDNRSGEISEFKAVDGSLSFKVTVSADSNDSGDPQSKVLTSSRSHHGSRASNIDSSRTTTVCSIVEPQALNSAKKKLPTRFDDGSNEDVETGNKFLSSKATTGYSNSGVLKEVKLEKIFQPCADDIAMDTEAFGFDMPAASTRFSHDLSYAASESSEKPMNTGEMDEVPTFDLGL